MLCQLVVQDLLDEAVVAGAALAGVVGDEQVVAQEDDRGQEVTDAVLVLITLHQLAHPHLLKRKQDMLLWKKGYKIIYSKIKSISISYAIVKI